MAVIEDTNIIYRSSLETLQSIQEELRVFLPKAVTMEAIIKKAETMDREFIEKNLSPGGCADLLGVTFFLHKLI